MKKQQKKIALDRETVRRLDSTDFGAVKGAVNYSTGAICTSHTPYACSNQTTCTCP